LILVSGRELQDLLAPFPRAGLFEWIVAGDNRPAQPR
jgi:hypothetical protein